MRKLTLLLCPLLGLLAGCDMKQAELVAEWKAYDGPLYCADFSPNGLLLAVGTGEDLVQVWDVHRRMQVARLLGPGDMPTEAVAFSPDSDQLASASFNTITVWDLPDGRIASKLAGHNSFVRRLAFFGDRRLASGSSDATVRVWNVPAGGPADVIIQHRDGVTDLAVHPLTQTTISADASGAVFTGGPQQSPLFRRPVQTLAVAGIDDEIGSGVAILGVTSDDDRGLSDMHYLPDKLHLVGIGPTGDIYLWRHGRGHGRPIATHAGAAPRLALSPDGQTIATVDKHGMVRLWRISWAGAPKPAPNDTPAE